jgi:hypothetical protein
MGKYKVTARVVGPEGPGEIVDKCKGERLVRYDNVDVGVTWVAKRDLQIETWQPKVGDRVRFKADNPNGGARFGKAGQEVIVHSVSDYEGSMYGKQVVVDSTGSTYRPHAPISALEPATSPVVADLWAPVVGKYGKTRDGRKALVLATHDEPFPFRAGGNHYNADGSHYYGDDYKDLVAEWVDEPVVAVEAAADATPTRKFKVGDRVKFKGSEDSDAATVATRNGAGMMSLRYDWATENGNEWWQDDELELITASPLAGNDNTVTLTVDSAEKANLLRAYADLLNAA